MNRILPIIFALAILVCPAFADKTRNILLRSGCSTVVEFDFPVAAYKFISGASTGSVSVEAGASSAIVSALEKPGRCQIEFVGGSGESLVVNLEVPDPLDETLIGLRKRARDFDGLKFRRDGTNIVASGTIDDPRDWTKFQKILALSEFRGKVRNKVAFRDVRREPVHVDVGLVFVRTDRLRDASGKNARMLSEFLAGGLRQRGADAVRLDGSVTNVLDEWSSAGILVGKTICSMDVRSDGFETTHRTGTWTPPSMTAENDAKKAPKFEYGIGLENRSTRLLDEKNVEVGFSLTIAGKPEEKAGANGLIVVPQRALNLSPTFRSEVGRTALVSGFHDAKDTLSLFRKEGWLQYDAGEQSDSGAAPENLALLVLVDAERTEER